MRWAACCCFVLLGSLILPSATFAKGPAYTDPAKTDKDFPIQGEYLGDITVGDQTMPVGVQVIANGKGNFTAHGYHGGLPGAGWDGKERVTAQGKWDGDRVVLDTGQQKAIIENGELTMLGPDGGKVATLKKTERKSPTLGKAAPSGAAVLFDGSTADSWKNGKLSEDKFLQQGTTSKPTFGSHKLHIEFRLPYMPEAKGQARGNSGIYLQGRYEVQMLDSFGLEGKNNECGGLYEIKDPDVNMCLPPLAWQTYDIDFQAAEFDDSGKVTKPARVTVYHNGVKIHDDVELPRSTRAAPNKVGPDKGPVYLQNHGNPVRYRNIWVVEKD